MLHLCAALQHILVVGLPGLEPGTSSLSVQYPTFQCVMVCPAIWLFCSIFVYFEHLLCPVRASLQPYCNQDGCSKSMRVDSISSPTKAVALAARRG